MNEGCTRIRQMLLEQGYDQLRLRAFEPALDTFTVCVLVDPEAADAYYGRAIANFELEDWDSAELDFQRATLLKRG